MTTNREITSTVEASAKQARRQYIATGHAVSLIAFDPSRNLYAFDVLN